ncbi:PAS domain-containing protein [Nostocaceae cyanobacterium CENA357]|uniref:PAS domain-containing protein n=1 Tax=Atlanticothrix silvestris CENA357 TaxID=1725252 RepID=A0A8J7L6Z8_9CYAN|nr:PAS domain-containing protein [Atlanticothrix silvestris]MBH8554632.1 PAS domain-containing protein [Atlanticothrix silvestris CENA357]
MKNFDSFSDKINTLENIQAVFWMTDNQSQQVLYVSKAYEKIWQKSCESLYQNYSNWLDAIHPEDRQRVELELIEQVKTSSYDKNIASFVPMVPFVGFAIALSRLKMTWGKSCGLRGLRKISLNYSRLS